ncbi:Lysosome-associated membrane glycoprotein 5 [Galemys pyrenaicus]|uniref:Lysosome-associated membrane glycoprotein 5 n=1 Tax=Galemys pyrenaicus TaxID=202257 RepID=A0A8J6DS48_GALPY|nr:Lysosome-associated membrane glycoprotein 5 [Galemys pyrenaicus]
MRLRWEKGDGQWLSCKIHTRHHTSSLPTKTQGPQPPLPHPTPTPAPTSRRVLQSGRGREPLASPASRFRPIKSGNETIHQLAPGARSEACPICTLPQSHRGKNREALPPTTDLQVTGSWSPRTGNGLGKNFSSLPPTPIGPLHKTNHQSSCNTTESFQHSHLWTAPSPRGPFLRSEPTPACNGLCGIRRLVQASAYRTRARSLLPLGAPAPLSPRLTPAATLRDSLSGGLCSSTARLIRCRVSMDLRGRALPSVARLQVLLMLLHTMARIMAEQEVENLSGLSTNPEKDIFVVRENGTTCLMAEFAAKFIVPYDVWASNYVDLITEQADISLTRGAEVKGHCGHNESELQVFWVDRAYALKMLFVKESHNTSKGPEGTWRLSKVQFVYDSSEKTHFKDAVTAGKHTANSHRLSALVTPAGKSYECQAQQTISLASSDPQKTVTMILSAVHIQPFDIISDFVFSEGRWSWGRRVNGGGRQGQGRLTSGWMWKGPQAVTNWVLSRLK